jgi:hypothetical protein
MASQLGLVHEARRALFFENTKVACQWFHQGTRMVINTKGVDRTNTTKSRGPQLIKINGNNFAGSQRKSADKNLTTPTIPPRILFPDAKELQTVFTNSPITTARLPPARCRLLACKPRTSESRDRLADSTNNPMHVSNEAIFRVTEIAPTFFFCSPVPTGDLPKVFLPPLVVRGPE